MAIDLGDVLIGLQQASLSATLLHSKDPSAGESAGERRTEVAAVSRELLHLADRLMALSSVVRSEYWTTKGQDPLL